MNYKNFNLEDWIEHISGAINDETTLDGNEMRDLVKFLSGLSRWIPASEDFISRQAMLDALDSIKYSEEFCKEHHIDWSVNLSMAHIAVNEMEPVNLRSATPLTSNDCISREALRQKLEENRDFFVDAYDSFRDMPLNEKARVDEIDNCIAMVVNALAVTPKQKVGKWIRVDEDKCKCDQCEIISFIAMYPTGDINYCPNCGAKMRVEQ